MEFGLVLSLSLATDVLLLMLIFHSCDAVCAFELEYGRMVDFSKIIVHFGLHGLGLV